MIHSTWRLATRSSSSGRTNVKPKESRKRKCSGSSKHKSIRKRRDAPSPPKNTQGFLEDSKNIRERGDAPPAQTVRDSAPLNGQKAGSVPEGGRKDESSRDREDAPRRRSIRVCNVAADDNGIHIREHGDAPPAPTARASAPSRGQKADSIREGGRKAESNREREGAPPRRSIWVSSCGK